MKRALAGLLLGLSACWAAHAAVGQPEGFMLQQDTSALNCLTPAPGDRKPIPYPENAKRRKESALVRVSLAFYDPQRPPRVTVIAGASDGEFDEAVKEHVSAYRLPCLRADAGTVTATQEFEFRPDDGRPVAWHAMQVAGPDIRSKGCEARRPPYPPFPRGAIDRRINFASLLVKMTFKGPTQPPVVTMLYQDASSHFVDAVTRWAAAVRLPCLKEDETAAATQMFHFAMEGDPVRVLNDLSLQKLVPIIDKLDEQHVYFDLNEMGCPFDVRLYLYQPVMTNSVGEVGTSDPRRAPFLDWLTRISFRLPPQAFSQLLGSPMTLSVPCTQLDLR